MGPLLDKRQPRKLTKFRYLFHYAREDSQMAVGESFVAGPSPIPFASQTVVTSHTALDHLVPPAIARDDEGREIAAAEAKGGERHHNETLQH
jgi:hypothetical protein